MKKIKGILLAFSLLCLSFTVSNQTQAQGGGYEPYVNLGASLTSGVTSLGGELGFYNNKARYSVGLSTASSESGSWYLSPKGYWKLTSTSSTNDVDCYATGAINLALDRTHALSVEPGVAILYNISKRFSPQVSFSLPIEENTQFSGRSWPFNAGISLNYRLQ